LEKIIDRNSLLSEEETNNQRPVRIFNGEVEVLFKFLAFEFSGESVTVSEEGTLTIVIEFIIGAVQRFKVRKVLKFKAEPKVPSELELALKKLEEAKEEIARLRSVAVTANNKIAGLERQAQ
jgi:hypothetical protein